MTAGIVPELKSRGEVDATVVIPTFNGEDYLRQILNSLNSQDFDGTFEILVIDSGSTDSTLEILRDFPEVRVHAIENKDFGHGKTRNLAARLARGTYVAYLTHDAVPATNSWLREILLPLNPEGLGAVAVLGKQIPRANCSPLLKYEIESVFAGFGPDFGTTIFYKDSFVTTEQQLDALSFYSDVNSATRRDFLLETIPYQDVPYSEDMAFGKEVIEAGYRKAYAPRAAVEHSNDLTVREYGPRLFDEVVGMRKIGHEIPPLKLWKAWAYIFFGSLRDSLRITRDPSFTLGRKAYWLFVNPLFHFAKWTGYRQGTLVDLSDQKAITANSLESYRKARLKD